MLRTISTYWLQLSKTGIDSRQPYSLQKRIILSNQLSILAVLGLGAVASIGSYAMASPYPFLIQLPISLCFAGIMALNAGNRHQLSRIMGSLLFPVLITAISIILKKNTAFHQEFTFYIVPRIIIFSSIVFSFVMICSSEKAIRVGVLGANIFILLLFNPLHTLFGVGIEQTIGAPKMYYIIDAVFVFGVLLMGGGIYLLSAINEFYEKQLVEALNESEENNKQLVNMNHELQASEEELRQQSETLALMNNNLTQAKENVKQLLAESLETTKQLKQAQKKIIQAEKMASLGQLTAGIAHEINNPINFISGGVQATQSIIEDYQNLISKYQALTSQLSPDQLKELREYEQEIEFNLIENKEATQTILKSIYTGIERTSTIVQGLQLFSNISEHKQQTVDLGLIIFQAAQELRESSQATIELNLGKSLILNCYPSQISQMLDCLLKNAIDAVSEGGNVQIHCAKIQASNSIQLIISDTGKGIEKENLSQIFNPFFTTKPTGSGIGLGLSIAYGIIQNHSGDISVDSQAGKGTTFTITLPCDFWGDDL